MCGNISELCCDTIRSQIYILMLNYSVLLRYRYLLRFRKIKLHFMEDNFCNRVILLQNRRINRLQLFKFSNT
jgi:hypothetical protein